MATATDDVVVDFDAIDAEVARGRANGATEVKDPPATEVEVAADAAPAADKTILKPEAGIEKLQKQLDTERQLRLASEARERDAANGEAEAQGRVQKTELELVKSAIERLTQSSDVLEAAYANAMAAQDWAAAAKAQRDMATNAARLDRLEAGKTALERAPKPTVREPTDPIEAYVSKIGSQYPRSQAWVRAHPEFATDKRKEQQMISAHNMAVSLDLVPDSDEYFESIERSLRLTPAAAPARTDTENTDDPTAVAAQATAKGRPGNGHSAPAAAPVSRSGGAPRKGTITLTPAQVEAAEVSGLSVEEYAKQVLALRN